MQAQVRLTEQTLVREQNILNEGAGTQQAVDNAQSAFDSAVADPRPAYVEGVAVGRPQWLFRPGYLVPVEFVLAGPALGFYVPIRALVLVAGQPAVFLAESDRARLVDVSVHETFEELQRIEGDGIVDGARVIVEISEVSTIETKSMVGLSIIKVTAGDDVQNMDQVSDDVRAKVESVQALLPQGAAPSLVNSDFGDVYEIVFSIHQDAGATRSSQDACSPRDLEVFAERIEEELELLDSVRRVELWGVQPEHIYVEVDNAIVVSDNAVGFMLGPPISDPVTGPDRDVIDRHAREMVMLFKRVLGTSAPYSYWGAPSLQGEIDIDADAANLAGVTNADVAFTTSGLLSGTLLTTYREGDHRVPVMLRTIPEQRRSLSDLADIYVNGQSGNVPLDSIATVAPSWQPAVILFAVPMAMIGVLTGLFGTGWAMGFMAMFGILSLGGIAINNAIVLVDFIETKVPEGADLKQAIASAGRERMRPIVLTTLTTIGGLLPLSLFGGVYRTQFFGHRLTLRRPA